MKAITYTKDAILKNQPRVAKGNIALIKHGKLAVHLVFGKKEVEIALFDLVKNNGDIAPIDNVVVEVRPNGITILKNRS
jgi:hypothetical protein